jgi:hypothetical protein
VSTIKIDAPAFMIAESKAILFFVTDFCPVRCSQMRRNGYGSAAIPTSNERALLQKVTTLQFENSALSLELKSMKEQQELFLEEVENEIQAQKSESLEAAEIEINQLQLQLRQFTKASQDSEPILRESSLNAQHKTQQKDNQVFCGVSVTTGQLGELETRLAEALEANLKMTQENMQLRKELESSLGLQQMTLKTSNVSLAQSNLVAVSSVAVQTSASDDVHSLERSSQDTADLLSRIRIENFRDVILRSFCHRVASAPLSRIFILWRCFVKEQANAALQKTLEAELLELTEIHQKQQLKLDHFQTSDQHGILLLWSYKEKIENSRIFANSRRMLRSMWKNWHKMLRIRRRVRTSIWRCRKSYFVSWRMCMKQRRTLRNLVEHKWCILKQKAISFWRHETLVGHVIDQQFQVQQAAEKFVTMHEAQNSAVLAIKQTCSEMMADLESSSLERNKILSLFLSCEGKLVYLFCFNKSNSIRRSMFQIWKQEMGKKKNLSRLQKRLTKEFVKRTLLIWYFVSKLSILNDFHERQISESIESLELERETHEQQISESIKSIELERETTAAALHNTEEELAETLTNLDDAILEIHQLIHMNNELSFIIQQKPSAECAIQTDESVMCHNSPLIAMSNVQIRDNEAQTEVVLDNPSQFITPNGQPAEQKP